MTGIDTLCQVGKIVSITLSEAVVVNELDYTTGEAIGQQTIPAGKHSFLYEINPFTEELCLQWQGLATGVFAPIPEGDTPCVD